MDGLKEGAPTLRRPIPIVPVRNLDEALAFYANRLHFELRHREARCAIVSRGSAELHLIEQNREAGTGTCRLEAREIDGLYSELREAGVLHPEGTLRQEWWGDRDFSALDLDGNLLTFFEPGP